MEFAESPYVPYNARSGLLNRRTASSRTVSSNLIPSANSHVETLARLCDPNPLYMSYAMI